MEFSQLPHSVLVHILRQVPPAQRLSSCAFVCTGWAAAAAEATDTLLFRYSPDQADTRQASLQRYLDSHGQHVDDLTVDVDELSVPIAALCSAATGLTRLACTATQLPGGAASLVALAALPNLRSLSVDVEVDTLPRKTPPDPSCVLPASALRHLPQLTSLSLQGALGLDTLQPLSALSNLQSLCLELNYGLQAKDADTSRSSDPALLPAPQQHAQQQQQQQVAGQAQKQEQAQGLQQLTHLQLHIPGLEVSSSGGAAGLSFVGLTALRSLVLSECSFDAALLQSMPLLQNLYVGYDVNLLGGGVTSLLHGISGLQHLDQLSLAKLTSPLAPATACAALTSSSKLRDLYLSDCQVAPGFWQHVFRPGCCLAALHTLTIQGITGAPLTSQDLHNMARCCPALQHLWLLRSQEPAVHLHPLTQLKRLQVFCLSGATDADASVLEQLTQLQDLTIAPHSPISTVALLQLTALPGLQRLCINREGGSTYSHRLANKAASGATPDVWYQLLLACTSEPQCQTAMMHRREEVLQRIRAAGLDASVVETAIELAQARADADAAASRLLVQHAELNIPQL